jgi:hypothetical protein
VLVHARAGPPVRGPCGRTSRSRAARQAEGGDAGRKLRYWADQADIRAGVVNAWIARARTQR